MTGMKAILIERPDAARCLINAERFDSLDRDRAWPSAFSVPWDPRGRGSISGFRRASPAIRVASPASGSKEISACREIMAVPLRPGSAKNGRLVNSFRASAARISRSV